MKIILIKMENLFTKMTNKKRNIEKKFRRRVLFSLMYNDEGVWNIEFFCVIEFFIFPFLLIFFFFLSNFISSVFFDFINLKRFNWKLLKNNFLEIDKFFCL